MSGIWLALIAMGSVLFLIQIAVVVVLLRVIGSWQSQLEQLGLPRGHDQPLRVHDEQLIDIEGEQFRLSDLWSSGGLLLGIVATNCVPCGESLRQLAEIYRSGPQHLLPVTILTIGSAENTRYLAEFSGLRAVARFAAVNEDTARSIYAVTVTPTLIVLDRQGALREILVGPADSQRLALATSADWLEPAA